MLSEGYYHPSIHTFTQPFIPPFTEELTRLNLYTNHRRPAQSKGKHQKVPASQMNLFSVTRPALSESPPPTLCCSDRGLGSPLTMPQVRTAESLLFPLTTVPFLLPRLWWRKAGDLGGPSWHHPTSALVTTPSAGKGDFLHLPHCHLPLPYLCLT